MPTYIIRAPNGKDVEMTSDKPPTEEQKAKIFREAGLDEQVSASDANKEFDSSSGGAALPSAGAASAVPIGAVALNAISKSSKFPELTGAIARGVTTAASLYNGISTHNPYTTFTAPGVGWIAGKGGYFLGKDFQKIAGPISEGLKTAIPAASLATAASGVQGGLDLAQMDDPKREDIGTLGVGPTDIKASSQAAVMGAQIKALVAQGKSQGEATRTVYNAWAKFLSEQRK